MVVEPKKGQKVVINGSKQAYKFVWSVIDAMQPGDKDKEHLFVIGVTGAYRVRYFDHVSMGTMEGTIAGAREIFRNAIRLGASSIILAHNHPSGSVSPSKRDMETTKVVAEAGKFLNIKLVDHLIVSDEGYYSFADEGRLEE
jgi:DNA repair protein RadC